METQEQSDRTREDLVCGARFSDAELERVRFTSVEISLNQDLLLQALDAGGVRLFNDLMQRIRDADLLGMGLSADYCPPVSLFLRFDNIDLSWRKLDGIDLEFCHIAGGDFSSCSLVKARFGSVARAKFRHADLRSAVFYNSDLTLADFTGSDVSNARFLSPFHFAESPPIGLPAHRLKRSRALGKGNRLRFGE